MKRRQFVQLSTLSGAVLTATHHAPVNAQSAQNSITEPARDIPIIGQTDICVLGGSCTGVFAAIRAARLGAKVCLVEKQNCFGGVATCSMVNVWHSLYNTEFNKQIIAGLTLETIERLKKRNAVIMADNNASRGCSFNSEELKIELDEMITEAGVKPYLHTFFSAPVIQDGVLTAIIVENKSGRGAILAKQFIDATGDGDLCHHLGLRTYTRENLQPPTTCARIGAWNTLSNSNVNKLLVEQGKEYNLPEGFIWGSYVPQSNVYMLAGTRVYDVNCANSEDLTNAEIEGRRQVRAIMDILRQHGDADEITLQALPSQIGIRETRHIHSQYQINGDDILYGKRFEDAIANGSYRVDIHHQNKPGITFRYLDGTEVYSRPGHSTQKGQWREQTDENPTFYQIPFRSLIPQGPYTNLITAGRMIDADTAAFSAIRVMVTMNQTGEAAGTAAWLALDENKSIQKLNPQIIRNLMTKEGSLII